MMARASWVDSDRMSGQAHNVPAEEGPSGQPTSRALNVLLINGSLRGARGNSQRVIALLQSYCRIEGVDGPCLNLSSFAGSIAELGATLLRANAFIVVSGCAWGSPGSVLQRFLEVATRWELRDQFLGKPAAVVTTMHSVGGLEAARLVASTLQLLGCLLPPLGTVALSHVGQMALTSGSEADIWRPEDLQVMTRNLLRAAGALQIPWQTWPVARAEAPAGAYPGPGLVDLDEAPWLVAPSPEGCP